MAFLALTSAQCDADSPLDETLFQLIRTNFDDHESRIGSNEALSDSSIRDDFTANVIDTDIWDTGGSTTPVISATPDHYCFFTEGGGIQFAGIAASTKKMRVDLDANHSIVFETRVKHTAATDATIFHGLQDEALSITAANIDDNTDMIGFIRGTNSNSLKFRTAKASTNAETDNLGNTSGWTKLRIEVISLSSGADITIRAYVDGVEISGSPFTDETKIPNILLRPYMGIHGGGGTRTCNVDYVLAYWTARPLSA